MRALLLVAATLASASCGRPETQAPTAADRQVAVEAGRNGQTPAVPAPAPTPSPIGTADPSEAGPVGAPTSLAYVGRRDGPDGRRIVVTIDAET